MLKFRQLAAVVFLIIPHLSFSNLLISLNSSILLKTTIEANNSKKIVLFNLPINETVHCEIKHNEPLNVNSINKAIPTIRDNAIHLQRENDKKFNFQTQNCDNECKWQQIIVNLTNPSSQLTAFELECIINNSPLSIIDQTKEDHPHIDDSHFFNAHKPLFVNSSSSRRVVFQPVRMGYLEDRAIEIIAAILEHKSFQKVETLPDMVFLNKSPIDKYQVVVTHSAGNLRDLASQILSASRGEKTPFEGPTATLEYGNPDPNQTGYSIWVSHQSDNTYVITYQRAIMGKFLHVDQYADITVKFVPLVGTE